MTLLRRRVAALPWLLALLAFSPEVLPAATSADGALPGRRSAPSDDSVLAEARVVVKYRSDSPLMRAASAARGGSAAPPRHAAALGSRLGLVLQDRHVLGARTQSLQAQGISAADLAQRLAAQPDVEWAEPVRRMHIRAVVPNDPYYLTPPTGTTPVAGQWYLRASDNTFVSAANAVGAWALTPGTAPITVAVLDTGVRFDHPDLAAKLYPGYDFISRTSTAADGDGADADATDPGDWNNANECGASDPGSNSSSWHGTQTAGLVGAATDNGAGMASMGRNVMVLPVRVLGKCGGYDDDIIAGMRWAAGLSSSPVVNSHPAKVINMSLGSTGKCDAASGNQKYVQVFNELAAAGVTVVVAAGNDEGLAVGLPADCPGALAVGALRHTGTKVGFSNVGPEVAISAPGGNCVNSTGTCLYPILTTTNSGATTASTNTYSNGSNYSVGTSFSAPLVAGAVGLMLSMDPTLTPTAIRNALRATARPFPTTGAASGVTACRAPSSAVQDECYCTTGTCGAGMLDAAAAVAAVVPAVVQAPAAVATAAAATPTAGDTVTVASNGSGAYGGRSITAYGWAITAGSTLAAISGASDGPSVALATGAAGTVTLQLTVVDSGGASSSSSVNVVVQAAPGTAVPPSGGGGGGGGGGALSAGWLLLLATAVGALARKPER